MWPKKKMLKFWTAPSRLQNRLHWKSSALHKEKSYIRFNEYADWAVFDSIIFANENLINIFNSSKTWKALFMHPLLVFLETCHHDWHYCRRVRNTFMQSFSSMKQCMCFMCVWIWLPVVGVQMENDVFVCMRACTLYRCIGGYVKCLCCWRIQFKLEFPALLLLLLLRHRRRRRSWYAFAIHIVKINNMAYITLVWNRFSHVVFVICYIGMCVREHMKGV